MRSRQCPGGFRAAGAARESQVESSVRFERKSDDRRDVLEVSTPGHEGVPSRSGDRGDHNVRVLLWATRTEHVCLYLCRLPCAWLVERKDRKPKGETGEHFRLLAGAAEQDSRRDLVQDGGADEQRVPPLVEVVRFLDRPPVFIEGIDEKGGVHADAHALSASGQACVS